MHIFVINFLEYKTLLNLWNLEFYTGICFIVTSYDDSILKEDHRNRQTSEKALADNWSLEQKEGLADHQGEDLDKED